MTALTPGFGGSGRAVQGVKEKPSMLLLGEIIRTLRQGTR